MERLVASLLLVLATATASPLHALRGGSLRATETPTDTPPAYLLPPTGGTCGVAHAPYMAPCSMSSMARWERLRELLEGGGGTSAGGAAASHDAPAREEAARKLISNHVHVLKDVTHTAPCTQTDLVRVDIALAPLVDQALREVARRLLGQRPGSDQLEETLDGTNSEQVSAWRGMAAFLEGRIQAMTAQHPGRQPDMSEGAAAAMRAVLREIADEEQSAPSRAAPPRAVASTHYHLLSPYFTPAHFARAGA